MCGIIGYAGARPAKQLLLQGLRRLEYRGYDSAGICLAEEPGLDAIRAVGGLENLTRVAEPNGSSATTGIGHTRWATHGRVSVENAHPLRGCDHDGVAIVLNGIVENFRELRGSLESEGHVFASDTDAEVVAHLIERHYRTDLVDAVRDAYAELDGHFAFVVLHRDEPELLAGARAQCPLVVGRGEGETFLASSVSAFLAETRQIQLVEEAEVVSATPDGAEFVSLGGAARRRRVTEVDWDDDAAEKDGHETFMLKEIHEQPAAVADTIGGDGLAELDLEDLRRVVVVACGTAYHAGLVGRHLIEEWARIPCDAEIASEWRYRDAPVEDGTLVVAVSQSGETADTIAALRLAGEKGARTLAITNMAGTQITREADHVLYTQAGLELGVAATKTFTAQTALLALLALELARVRRALPEEDRHALVDEVHALPEKIAEHLDAGAPIDEIARRHHRKPFFLYLGRHVGLPVCLEGALKLKEISYIPTDAYSAGEMKHGPIALLDETTPVVCIATDSPVYDKVVSNIEETRARGAHVIAIATEGNEDIRHHASDVVYVPRTHPLLQPLLAVLPLQLLAYRIARLRGLDVDRPRNLAKTVTVE